MLYSSGMQLYNIFFPGELYYTKFQCSKYEDHFLLNEGQEGLFLEFFRNRNVHLGHHFYCSIPLSCCERVR